MVIKRRPLGSCLLCTWDYCGWKRRNNSLMWLYFEASVDLLKNSLGNSINKIPLQLFNKLNVEFLKNPSRPTTQWKRNEKVKSFLRFFLFQFTLSLGQKYWKDWKVKLRQRLCRKLWNGYEKLSHFRDKAQK